jgi:hypothetical protein
VLSKQRDEDNKYKPLEAKCTIDTGNMQGNLVSQVFVEILGIAEENYHELTEDEKLGGTSVTGHTFIPKGAVYLTWYHQKPTRVFRNMRFLVLPGIGYDLIIGARSILKDNLLGVPNITLPKQFERSNPTNRTNLYGTLCLSNTVDID